MEPCESPTVDGTTMHETLIRVGDADGLPPWVCMRERLRNLQVEEERKRKEAAEGSTSLEDSVAILWVSWRPACGAWRTPATACLASSTSSPISGRAWWTCWTA